MSTTYAFVGPSVPLKKMERFSGIRILPPIAGGDLLRLDCQPGDRVLIIDGYFGTRPAVKHKEILYILDRGISIYGASSMGALRAAELSNFGMIGHGRIFRDLCSGELDGDDEVSLLHGLEEEGFQPYTAALVNWRYALADSRDRILLPDEELQAFLSTAKETCFTERTLDNILRLAAARGVGDRSLKLIQATLSASEDYKQTDAIDLLDFVSQRDPSHDSNLIADPVCGKVNQTVYLHAWKANTADTRSPGSVSPSTFYEYVRLFSYDFFKVYREVGAKHLIEFRGFGNPHTMTGCKRSDSEAVLDYLRHIGLITHSEEPRKEFDSWCTAIERSSLPSSERIAQGAIRALFPPQALQEENPFMDFLLRQSWLCKVVQNRVSKTMLFNEEIRSNRPDFIPSKLKNDRVSEWYKQLLGVSCLEDEAVVRGFSSEEDLIRSLKPYYLYHKVNSGLGLLRIYQDDSESRTASNESGVSMNGKSCD
ncbi:TfuA-like protein [Streptomyces sp. TX20-6-3]|uniref:TfuA-like protein n=1 Tax=Streptomyces sp. TX20-6-3 TaxID=3028705 RepID=UPI0029B4A29F|nr:TfuA-like protein [Streptomyces sp. TX20-6-3]MDX2565389.1 TfuA-like protein [Streptomyces sp. TX20-6-3]